MQMNKLSFFVLLSTILFLIISSCTIPSGTNEEAITTAIAETQQIAYLNELIQTATQMALEPPASDTPVPINSLEPTNTPRPTSTPRSSWTPIAISDFEEVLRDAGYRRYPWTTEDGLSAFNWIRENAYEQVTTWEDGSFELEVLHDSSANVRSEHMEMKFKVMDKVFPREFMTRLRQENKTYNRSVLTNLSGTPDERYAYGGEWQEVWAEYYTEFTSIGGYDVWFSVWWWQSTCPSQYGCYYPNFPGLDFFGDSSFKFYTIYVEPNESNYFSSTSS
jgi:hypothetical protein